MLDQFLDVYQGFLNQVFHELGCIDFGVWVCLGASKAPSTLLQGLSKSVLVLVEREPVNDVGGKL